MDTAPSESPSFSQLPGSDGKQRSRRTLFIVVSIIALSLCACVGIAALTIGRGILSLGTEQATITPVLDQFMQAMVSRDVNGAYALFSTRAQRQTPITDVETMFEGANYVLFEGYQSLTIESTNLSTNVNTDQDVPQGQVATVSGTITYAGDITGSFRATLEKEGGAWRLHAINITVPPSKALK